MLALDRRLLRRRPHTFRQVIRRRLRIKPIKNHCRASADDRGNEENVLTPPSVFTVTAVNGPFRPSGKYGDACVVSDHMFGVRPVEFFEQALLARQQTPGPVDVFKNKTCKKTSIEPIEWRTLMEQHRFCYAKKRNLQKNFFAKFQTPISSNKTKSGSIGEAGGLGVQLTHS